MPFLAIALLITGIVALYQGDARNVLARLIRAGLRADLVLTDPPYGISYRSRDAKSPAMSRPIAGDTDLNTLRDAMPLLDDALLADRHAYVFAGAQRLSEALDVVAAIWPVRNCLVWDKGNQGTRGDLECGYASNWEAIIYAMKGRRPLAPPRPRTVYRYDWSAKRDPVHPTVKPVALLAFLIAKSSRPGELVIDPFAGSGTTLRAARDLGRRAVGIELDAHHCKQAIARLRRSA